jgi:hypothetical protein
VSGKRHEVMFNNTSSFRSYYVVFTNSSSSYFGISVARFMVL